MKYRFRTSILILVILMSLLMCEGCGKQEDFKQDNYNDVEILSTKKVVDLLKENGVILTKSYNFPIDLLLCKIHDKKPKPYFNSQTGVYYMFYEYDGYSEISDLIKQSPFYDYPECDKEFSDYRIPGTGSIGKNMYICLWYSGFGRWTDCLSKIELEDYDCIMKDNLKLKDVLKEKCFDKKVVTLIGQGDSWEVKIPIKYVYNHRVNKKGITERVFYSMDETFVKYLNSQKELPNVISISLSNENNKESITIHSGASILREENADGYYSVSPYGSCSSCNPEIESNVIVTITCSNGETEEITCTTAKTN